MIKKIYFASCFCFLLFCIDIFSQSNNIKQFNVIWKNLSISPAESMPLCGIKGCGANIWVENGLIYCYLASSESYDENGNLLKLGTLRIMLTPNPFINGFFKQELDLWNGKIIITGISATNNEVKITLWYDMQDMENVTLYIKCESTDKIQCNVSYANWRMHPDSVNLDNYDIANGISVISPDVVEQKDNSIFWYHQNDNNRLIVRKMIELQKFTDYANEIQPFTENLIFGGMVVGENMKAKGSENIEWLGWKGKAWHMESELPSTLHQIAVLTKVEKEKNIQDWKRKLREGAISVFDKMFFSEKKSIEWWHSFWNKSYIIVNAAADLNDEGWQIGRNYQLFRYMLACNRGSRIPLKFNGGIFTTGPLNLQEMRYMPNSFNGYWPESTVTPDYRRWGNLFMAQNQRLIGWPALATGDFDLVSPSIDFYADRLKVAEARSKAYWGHQGAAFPEPLSLYGLPVQNLATDCGPVRAKHLAYHFSIQIEFAWMAIQWANYSGKSIVPYLPFIESVIRFYDKHYRKERLRYAGKELDEDGKLVFYPMNSLEIYAETTNPVEVVAGLQKVTEELLKMRADVLPDTTRQYIAKVSATLPSINFEVKEGKRVIKPAQKYKKDEILNDWEFPEMYTVWPYSIFGVHKKEGFLEANNTWELLPKNRQNALSFWSWMCTPIYAALLGRTSDAKRLIIEKLSDKNANVKFPAFFGPGHDWLPDHNWGGSGMVGLQSMLLHCDGNSIYLLPAWPKEWDVEFKLYAPYHTIIEASVHKGKITSLKVIPETRRKDVIINPRYN